LKGLGLISVSRKSGKISVSLSLSLSLSLSSRAESLKSRSRFGLGLGLQSLVYIPAPGWTPTSATDCTVLIRCSGVTARNWVYDAIDYELNARTSGLADWSQMQRDYRLRVTCSFGRSSKTSRVAAFCTRTSGTTGVCGSVDNWVHRHHHRKDKTRRWRACGSGGFWTSRRLRITPPYTEPGKRVYRAEMGEDSQRRANLFGVVRVDLSDNRCMWRCRAPYRRPWLFIRTPLISVTLIYSRYNGHGLPGTICHTLWMGTTTLTICRRFTPINCCLSGHTNVVLLLLSASVSA